MSSKRPVSLKKTKDAKPASANGKPVKAMKSLNGKSKSRRKKKTADELMLELWQSIYDEHHPSHA
jgi:hypothetical protein